MRLPVACSLALLSLLRAAPARAQDAFEIQVYDAATAEAGTGGLELHSNVVATGQRETGGNGELPTHHVAHFTLEPHFGLTRFCEAGVYIQTALRPDGLFDYGGIKLRVKLRVPRRLYRERIGLAINFEYSDLPAAYEANRYGSEIRPVIDLRLGRFYSSVNPIVGIDLAGPLAGRPQLAPAAKVSLDVTHSLALGVEYYAALGPIDAPFAASQQTHRLFAAADFEHTFGSVRFGLNAAAGYGLAAGDRVLIKLIMGLEFGR